MKSSLYKRCISSYVLLAQLHNPVFYLSTQHTWEISQKNNESSMKTPTLVPRIILTSMQQLFIDSVKERSNWHLDFWIIYNKESHNEVFIVLSSFNDCFKERLNQLPPKSHSFTTCILHNYKILSPYLNSAHMRKFPLAQWIRDKEFSICENYTHFDCNRLSKDLVKQTLIET